MNQALIYGSSLNLVSRTPRDERESVDSDMSDDEAALSNFLAPDSDDEPNSVGWVTSGPTVIPESTLTQRMAKMNMFHSNKDCRRVR
jgi:hypothetical protein